MKKLWYIFVFALFLGLFAGCSASEQTSSPPASTSAPAAATAPSTPASTPTSPVLTREEALQIALKHAGLTADQVSRVEIEPDYEWKEFHYDVEFHYEGYEYDYEVNGVGVILKSEKERD